LAGEDDIDDWASTEFGEANLGDARLVRRLVALARRLAAARRVRFRNRLNPLNSRPRIGFSTIHGSIQTESWRRISRKRWIA
jgi:hypothetical protein